MSDLRPALPPLLPLAPPPPHQPGRTRLRTVTVVAVAIALVVVKLMVIGGKANGDDAAAADSYVDRQRSIESEKVFSRARMAAELRLLRRALRKTERARNLVILLDGSMATYTRQGPRFYWLETDGETVDRKRVREYPSKLDPSIDLRQVRAATPRKVLMKAEIKFQPRIWKLDALTLAPHPADPDELMWTISWTDPTPKALYADAAGRDVGRTYPPPH